MNINKITDKLLINEEMVQWLKEVEAQIALIRTEVDAYKPNTDEVRKIVPNLEKWTKEGLALQEAHCDTKDLAFGKVQKSITTLLTKIRSVLLARKQQYYATDYYRKNRTVKANGELKKQKHKEKILKDKLKMKREQAIEQVLALEGKSYTAIRGRGGGRGGRGGGRARGRGRGRGRGLPYTQKSQVPSAPPPTTPPPPPPTAPPPTTHPTVSSTVYPASMVPHTLPPLPPPPRNRFLNFFWPADTGTNSSSSSASSSSVSTSPASTSMSSSSMSSSSPSSVSSSSYPTLPPYWNQTNYLPQPNFMYSPPAPLKKKKKKRDFRDDEAKEVDISLEEAEGGYDGEYDGEYEEEDEEYEDGEDEYDMNDGFCVGDDVEE